MAERQREVAWFCRYDQSHWSDEKKKARTGKDPQLLKAVFTWFVKEMQVGTLINGPVLSIGRFMKLCCFHQVNMMSMPIDYTSSSNDWMTSIIFKEWFMKTFVPQVRARLCKLHLPQKAVLLLDNCPAHTAGDILPSCNIKVLYILKNTTSKIQPLDQGIMLALKGHYHRT